MSSFLYSDDNITIILSSTDGTYIIEFLSDFPYGLNLKANDNDSRVIIDSITTSFQEYLISINILDKVQSIIEIGDIIISINNDIMIDKSLLLVSQKLLSLQGTSRSFIFIKELYYNDYIKNNSNSTKKELTDIYGFIRNESYMLQDQYYSLKQIQDIITNRDLQWISYLKSIGGPANLKPSGIHRSSEPLKSLVRRGIPVAFRGMIWQKISLSSIHRSQYPSDYFKTLVKNISQLNEKVNISIEKDLSRTFPEHPRFDSDEVLSSLRVVLQCYAMHNPNVGYCQSLNFLVGIMLLFMNEEDTFWLLATVIEKLLPSDYYTKSMIGIYVDQYVLGQMVKIYLPQIHQKLEDNQLQLPIITVQWFLCMFVNTLRTEVGLRVWDMFLNEGNKVLFRISMALFKSAQKNIISAKDPGDLFVVLRNIGSNIVDADELISMAYKSYTHPKFGKKKTNNVGSSLPFDLTGLGLAHLGFAALSITKDTSPSESSSNSPESPLSQNKSNSTAHDERNTLYHTYRSPEPYPTPSIETNLQNSKEQNENKITRRRSSSFLTRQDYRSIKRKDIDNWRQEFLPELQLKFEMMEKARNSFKENEERLSYEKNISNDNQNK